MDVFTLKGNAATGSAAFAGTTTLISGVADMVDGTTEAKNKNVANLVDNTWMNTAIGFLSGLVFDVMGKKADLAGTTGRGSFTQVYRMADTIMLSLQTNDYIIIDNGIMD